MEEIRIEDLGRYPGFIYNGVPAEFRQHPLVRGRLFFTIPERLLQGVVEELGVDRFDPNLLELEAALARPCKDHSFQVGFWGGRPITNYSLLHPADLQLSDEQAAYIGLDNPAKKALFLDDYEAQRDSFIGVARGYCGWLMLNRQFRDEHREHFRTWAAQIEQHGSSQPEVVVQARRNLPAGYRRTRGRTTAFGEATARFLARWQLNDLPAPYLPCPHMPQLPVSHLPSVLGHMRHGGTVFFLPASAPIPSRDELRRILETSARRSQAPEHLRAWQSLVAAGNSGKNTITRFARLFEFHHFWGALHQRHPKAVYRRVGHLEQVFADYFDVSPDLMHRDLRFIGERLGPGWATLD